ncbi:hypothetical protein B0H13DRAFT_2318018 [Mycena leptocephala]|nr:hypothetical protein B0H13DRAFT_2318018 [Mycena leptocephala]
MADACGDPAGYINLQAPTGTPNVFAKWPAIPHIWVCAAHTNLALAYAFADHTTLLHPQHRPISLVGHSGHRTPPFSPPLTRPAPHHRTLFPPGTPAASSRSAPPSAAHIDTSSLDVVGVAGVEHCPICYLL